MQVKGAYAAFNGPSTKVLTNFSDAYTGVVAFEGQAIVLSFQEQYVAVQVLAPHRVKPECPCL
jgi:predicted oxidoreductase (fatty acid repression mutant protein)